MLVKYSRLREFNTVAGSWLKNNPKESKLSYAISKIGKQFGSIFTRLNEDLQTTLSDLEIDSYSIDKDGFVIKNKETGRPHQTPDALKKLNKDRVKEIRKFDEETKDKEFEITPFIVDKYPELTEEEIELFTGIVI